MSAAWARDPRYRPAKERATTRTANTEIAIPDVCPVVAAPDTKMAQKTFNLQRNTNTDHEKANLS